MLPESRATLPYHDAALSYAARGWRVFALAAGQKVPRKGTRGVLEATVHRALIDAWWEDMPLANVGIACGEASGLFVLDVDPRHGGDRSLAELVVKHGPLPHTITVATGGGGYQYYFQHCPGLRSGAGKLGEGLDHRTDGGYVVAPPSLHPSGEYYSFMVEDADLAPVPQWIAEALKRPTQQRSAAAPEYYRDLFKRGARDGERNDALVRMAGHLIRKRIDPHMVLDILGLWNEHRLIPPGDPEKLVGIVDRVAGRELERITKRRET